MGCNLFPKKKHGKNIWGMEKKHKKREKKNTHPFGFWPVCTGAFSSSPGRTEANCLGNLKAVKIAPRSRRF